MACEQFRDVMLEVLYGERGTASTRELEIHQQHCASCRDEMRGLRALRRDLREWTVPAGPARRRGLAADAGRWLPLAAALAIGIAGGLAFVQSQDRMKTLSAALEEQDARHRAEIAALESSLAQGTFAPSSLVASSLAPSSLATVSPTAEATVDHLRRLIRESEARQALVLQASLRGLAERADAQRREDLAQVSAGFTYLEGRTGLQVARTTELMGHVLQASQKK